MKSISLLLCLALSLPAVAQDLSVVIVMKKGDLAPSDGVLVQKEHAVTLAQRIKGCEAENKALKTKPVEVPWGVVVAVAASGLVVGAGVGIYAGFKLSDK